MPNDIATTDPIDALKEAAKEAKVEAAKAKTASDKAAKALAVAEKGLTKAKEALTAAQEAAKDAKSKEAKKIASDDVAAKKSALAVQETATKDAKKLAESAATHAATLQKDSDEATKAFEDEKAKRLAAAKKAADIELPQIAKEINVRVEKAEKLDGQADDHRLAAAIQTARAEKLLKESGGDFEAWFKENIKSTTTGGQLADRTRRFFLLIGRAENPAEKLKEVREGNKAAAAKSRLIKAAGEGKKDEPVEGDDEAQPAAKADGKANTSGPEDDDADYNRAVAAFEKLTAKDRMTFLTWAADLVGAKIAFDL